MNTNMEAMRAFADQYMAEHPRVEQPAQRDRGIPLHYRNGLEGVDLSKVIPLGRSEYEAIKQMQGAMQLIRYAEIPLEGRIRQMGVWPRFRSAQKMLRNICKDMMDTVDPNKRIQMQIELNNSDIHIEIKKCDKIDGDHGFGYFDAHAVQELIDMVGTSECLLCSKTNSEISDCRVRKALSALQTRAVGQHTGGCPFEGFNTAIELGIEEDQQ